MCDNVMHARLVKYKLNDIFNNIIYTIYRRGSNKYILDCIIGLLRKYYTITKYIYDNDKIINMHKKLYKVSSEYIVRSLVRRNRIADLENYMHGILTNKNKLYFKSLEDLYIDIISETMLSCTTTSINADHTKCFNLCYAIREKYKIEYERNNFCKKRLLLYTAIIQCNVDYVSEHIEDIRRANKHKAVLYALYTYNKFMISLLAESFPQDILREAVKYGDIELFNYLITIIEHTNNYYNIVQLIDYVMMYDHIEILHTLCKIKCVNYVAEENGYLDEYYKFQNTYSKTITTLFTQAINTRDDRLIIPLKQFIYRNNIMLA